MPKAKYQLEDFLEIVVEGYKKLVMIVHDMLLQDGYKPKIQVTKSTGLQLAYYQPKIKTVAGIILILFMRDEKLMIRIYASNHKAYPQALGGLPKSIASQIDNADDCVKFVDPQKCWNGCGGYDFIIGEKQYQKCITNCFQIALDNESMPYLLEIIENESKARLKS